MNKIACYNCSSAIDIDELDEFSNINCPECKHELKVPKIVGPYIFEEILSSNRHYKTYKGHKANSEETLVIKVIEDFRSHTEDVHGIDYSKEAVMQFILRKQG